MVVGVSSPPTSSLFDKMIGLENTGSEARKDAIEAKERGKEQPRGKKGGKEERQEERKATWSKKEEDWRQECQERDREKGGAGNEEREEGEIKREGKGDERK